MPRSKALDSVAQEAAVDRAMDMSFCDGASAGDIAGSEGTMTRRVLPGGLTMSDPAMLGRLARDLPRFLRQPIARDQVGPLVRERLTSRATRFVALAERAIYGRRDTPYRRLLRAAGCEAGDFRALVEREGVEDALAALAGRGVYVTFDEFKGRTPIERGSTRFTAQPSDFDLRSGHHFRSQTGGSGGAPAVVEFTLPFVHELALTHAAALQAHRLARATEAFWLTIPFIHVLRSVRGGQRPVAWFHPQPLPWKVSMVGRLMRAAGRRAGVVIPRPAALDLSEPERLVRWLAGRARRGETDCVTTTASAAVRAATAARDLRLSLDGVTFVVLGEPFTPAKQAALTDAGIRPIVLYGCMEGPAEAYGCATPKSPDDCHVFTDAYAFVPRPRADGAAVAADALMVTSLLPSAPKLLLNLEVGDQATLERRDCGCALGALGLRTHISDIRSYEKLTGEGVTFARTGLIRILEETLPARFGGGVSDYQVLEEEDAEGLLRLHLLVSPRVGPLDEAALERAFLAEIGRTEPDRHMATVWQRAGTVRVRRQAPIVTPGSKIQPFHSARRATRPSPRVP